MRWEDIVGLSVGSVWLGMNVFRLWHGALLNVLDVFFLNLALCIVCYFLNPDITTFNTSFFNGKGWTASYQQAIVNSSDAFPESPTILMLFWVSLLIAMASLVWYIYLTRQGTKSTALANPTSLAKPIVFAKSITPTKPTTTNNRFSL